MLAKWSFAIAVFLIYTLSMLTVGVAIRKHFELPPPACPLISSSQIENTDQDHTEKGVDHYEEHTKLPDGTEIDRKGIKEFSIEDYLKGFKSIVKTVQIPAPPADNFSFDLKFKDIEKFPNVEMKSADIGVRFTDHYWAIYSKDFQNGDNTVGVRYTSRVCLWRCP